MLETWVVVWQLSNGYRPIVTCDTEDEAHRFAQGVAESGRESVAILGPIQDEVDSALMERVKERIRQRLAGAPAAYALREVAGI